MTITTREEQLGLGPRGKLLDSYGRLAKELRISVTDRCNFRCSYCMPQCKIQWMPRRELLSFEEITKVASIFVRLGIDSIRLTGGEPLARAHLERLVSALAELPIEDLSLTTNGFALAKKADALAEAGLMRVNVSLDSLNRHKFASITGVDGLHQVLRGLEAARRANLDPIKVNCVIIRGVNDDEVVRFAGFARDYDYHVRFIEFMPLDSSGIWSIENVVPADEILEKITAKMQLVPRLSSGPAETYGFADTSSGSVGVIPSVTRPFCAECDRIRLTADGQLRYCLFALEETDLKSLLRAGRPDCEIEAAITSTVAMKWAGHRIGQPDFLRPSRPMHAIGG